MIQRRKEAVVSIRNSVRRVLLLIVCGGSERRVNNDVNFIRNWCKDCSSKYIPRYSNERH